MNMSEIYKRRIRIESVTDKTRWSKLKITDLETGEEVTHVARAVITLDARQQVNVAELTYFEHDEDGTIAMEKGEPIIKTVTVSSPDIQLDASERFEPPFYTYKREPQPIRFLHSEPGAPL